MWTNNFFFLKKSKVEWIIKNLASIYQAWRALLQGNDKKIEEIITLAKIRYSEQEEEEEKEK